MAVAADQIAPYFAYFDPTAGLDGAFRYVAPSVFGDSYRHTMLNRSGYWAKSYVDANLTFIDAGGTFNNSSATYQWADVRVDNGTREMTLAEADDANLMISMLYYYDTGWKYIDDVGDKDYFDSWEGLFVNSDYNLTFIRRN